MLAMLYRCMPQVFPSHVPVSCVYKDMPTFHIGGNPAPEPPSTDLARGILLAHGDKNHKLGLWRIVLDLLLLLSQDKIQRA